MSTIRKIARRASRSAGNGHSGTILPTLLGIALLIGCAPDGGKVGAPTPAATAKQISEAPENSLPTAETERPPEELTPAHAESETQSESTRPVAATEPPPATNDFSADAAPEETDATVSSTLGEVAVVDETDIESLPETPDVPEEDESGRYEFRELHDPNGIGKFYMDREIAWVMGFAAAPWLERPEREKEEATSQLIKALDLKGGMFVADIGAGSGVLTLPIAKRVGPRGKVYAVDVQQEMLDRLSARARSRNIHNVELVLGTEKSPRLKPERIDLALMVDVYHEFAFPYEMIRETSKAMKPGGRVVFVEFRMEDPNVPIKLVHKMTEAQVKKEIGLPEFRLKWKETIGTLPWQHVIVFEKQGAEEPDQKGASSDDKGR